MPLLVKSSISNGLAILILFRHKVTCRYGQSQGSPIILGVYSLDEGEILNSRRKVVDVFGVDDLT